MKRRDLLVGAVATATLVGLPRAARADGVSDALAQIAKARASVKTLLAPFSQERTIGLLSAAVKSDGEMTLVRPDALRWELKPPDAITYWITRDGFGYATAKGGANVGKSAAGRFGAVLADMLILLGGDLEKLRQRYELTVPDQVGGMTLVAKPRAEEVAKLVKQLEMRVGPELWSVQRVVIEEKGGDKSVITFGAVSRDVKVDPARMKPPAKSG